jgi:hypothetical protein
MTEAVVFVKMAPSTRAICVLSYEINSAYQLNGVP